ncbi:serine/threonine-protein kinase [Aliarcobacter butzleri]|uniref:serine/threonine-protein kinase n=1 Tax=Aliarcobacter butzleri TaxID=28197 RepID=UPI001EDA2FEF|nr:serine/threonine-protein kinase [Aliarcobacter butzleri]MCG3690338.1 serine/threonine protein kinase [Aliarcobacter butzleri]
MHPKPYLNIENVKAKFPDIQNLELFDVGGQKIVYKGIHSTYGEIMLKFFKTNEMDPRIKREIEIAKKLIHENIPKLYFAGTIEFDEGKSKTVFLIEEYINGITLRNYIQQNDIEIKQLKIFIETIFSILDLLKTKNMVHRDLKPENIMVKDNLFYILDFGIARILGDESITNSSSPMGPHTLGYAPWEQINNEKYMINEKTDLFSMAVISQEMITKEHPFFYDINSGTNALAQTKDMQIKPLAITSPCKNKLEPFLHTLMSKAPSSRPTLEIAKDWFNEFKEEMI